MRGKIIVGSECFVVMIASSDCGHFLFFYYWKINGGWVIICELIFKFFDYDCISKDIRDA